MELVQALQLCARNTDFIAHRGTKVFIAMTDRQVIMRVFIPRPYKWAPCYGDLIASDWEVEMQQTLVAKLRQQLPQGETA